MPSLPPVRHAGAVLAALFLTLSPVADSWSAPFDSRPKILLHVASPVTKTTCSPASLDGDSLETSAPLNAGRYVYVLTARGDLPNISGLEFGITYDNGKMNGSRDHSGIDILDWVLCATMEFPTSGSSGWPNPETGNLITWDAVNFCQAGDLAVAGYFYVTAYAPGTLQVVPRPVSGIAAVVTCSAIVRPLADSDLGRVRFSSGAAEPGCNPWVEPCATPPEADCTVSPSVLEFDEVTVGENAEETFSITNRSGAPISGTVTEDGTNFEIVGDPEYSLADGETASFVLRYTATMTLTETCTVHSGNGCPDIPVTVRAVPAIACATSPGMIDFGYVPIGTSADRTFTIENNGAGPFDVRLQACYTWWSDPQYSIVGERNFTLNPGGTADVVVRYTPSERAQASCQISMGLAGCRMVDVIGTGLPDVGCRLSTEFLSFGELKVGQSGQAMFQITNLGGPPISGELSLPANPGGQFSFQGATTYYLTAGQTAWFTVRFNPNSAGPAEGLIDAGCDRSIRCFGYAHPAANGSGVATPNSLNFGYVAIGDSAYLPVTVTNYTDEPLVGTVGDGCPDFYVTDPDHFNLAKGESDTLTVVFKPSTRTLQTCTLYIPGCQPVSCAGNTVTIPPLAVQPDFLNFGSVSPGETAVLSFSITNPGIAPLGGTLLEQCSDFQVDADVVSLSPGETGNFKVTFTPSAAGVQNCDIHFLNSTLVRCVANQSSVPVRPTTWSDIKTRY